MRILAQFVRETLPTIRRIQAPFSVLTDRGYDFHFQHNLQFHTGMCYDYDVTVIQNWVFTPEELDDLRVLCAQYAVVYDLTSPDLLALPSVCETLALVRVVTVPNERLAKEVGRLARRVEVLPSVIHPPYFTQAQAGKAPRVLGRTLVGCFGSHDWDLLAPVIQQLAATQKFTFWGDSDAQEALGELVIGLEVTPDNYPRLLRQVDLGLCPLKQESVQDLIVPYEYGILGIPVVASADSPYSQVLRTTGRAGTRPAFLVENGSPDRWVSIIGAIAKSPVLRQTAGKAARELALSQRATQLAKRYQRLYDEIGVTRYAVGRV